MQSVSLFTFANLSGSPVRVSKNFYEQLMIDNVFWRFLDGKLLLRRN